MKAAMISSSLRSSRANSVRAFFSMNWSKAPVQITAVVSLALEIGDHAGLAVMAEAAERIEQVLTEFVRLAKIADPPGPQTVGEVELAARDQPV